jgi:hypothetical protein
MADYRSISYTREAAFDVEEDLRSGEFELEKGESATKIAYLLCGKAALIGEFVISEEGKAEILREACCIFRMMCEGKKDRLLLTDGRVLAVACVLLTRNSINTTENEEDQDHAEIWKPILEGLNFPEISEKTGCSEQVARRYICDVLKDRYNVRFFAEGGQKYYNTLRLHALSPEWAIKNLYNVLYGFYHKNLECSYYPESNVASMFVSGIRRRWVTTMTKAGEKQNIQSDRLSSSLRELFVLRPRYMAAVCDAMLEKIDRIVQGDLTKLDNKNRWDVLLQEWYQSKTAYEKSRMTTDRKAAVRKKVVDRKENIRPEYTYENKSIYLSIPGIRLPEIQEAPFLELYQNDQLILKQRLTIYGNDVLWSTRAYRIPLNQIPGVNWKKRFCFMIRIVSGKNEIYCSGSDLYREYLCFNPVGNESRLVRCNQILHLIVRKAAKLTIEDPENRYTEETAPYRSINLWMDSVSGVLLNGIDILEDNHSDTKKIWAYLTPEYDPRVCARFEGKTVSVYSDRPVLHVVLSGQADAKNYQITINDTTEQLYQFPYENGQFRIPLPAIMERKHTVQLKDFDSGEIVFLRSYTIVPGLSCEFDRPFYLDTDIEGKLYINSNRRKVTHRFQLEQGIDKVTWQMAGLDYEIIVPKVFAEIAEKNAFYLAKSTWYEELKDSFLTIRMPEDVNCAVVFADKFLAPNYAGSYEIGVAIDNRNTARFGALLGIIVSSQTWKLEWKLTFVHFQEHFKTNPIVQEGRRILWDPINAGYIGGEEDPMFRLELENDQQADPFQYVLRMSPDTVERDFPCRTGTYKYVLWLTGRKKMFTNLPDLRLVEGEILVEDPPEDRFAGKHIILTRAYYCDPQRGNDVNVRMKHDGALIDEIRYEGIREKDGKLVHEYSGYMYFKAADRWRVFSDVETDLFEKINPVFFTIEDDEHVNVYLEEDDAGLMLNIKSMQQRYQHGGVQIFSRKNELTKVEQSKYLAFAEKFKFIERNN